MSHQFIDFGSDCYTYDVKAFFRKRNKGLRYGDFNTPREAHILIFIHEGKIRFDSQEGCSVTVSRHEMIYIPKGSRCISTYCEDETELTSIHFQIAAQGKEITLSEKTEVMSAAFAARFEPLFRAFQGKSRSNNPNFRRQQMLYMLFDALSDTNIDRLDDPQYIMILPGVNYLADHFTENIPISEIAKKAMVSECYFRRLFKKFYHESPISYRNNMRLEYVDELLQSGLYTISEANSIVGFSDTHLYYKMKNEKKE